MKNIISIIFSAVSYIIYILVVASPANENISISENFLLLALLFSFIAILFGALVKNRKISIVLMLIAGIPILIFVASLLLSLAIA